MTVRQLNIRIPLEMMAEIEEIARQEDLGKTDVARRLLHEGIKHWKLEHALGLYREGRISKARAAEMAGVSIYEMIDLIRERSIPLQYSLAVCRRNKYGCRQSYQTGRDIDNQAGCPGFHPVLMPKKRAQQGHSHVQALLFLAAGTLKQPSVSWLPATCANASD